MRLANWWCSQPMSQASLILPSKNLEILMLLLVYCNRLVNLGISKTTTLVFKNKTIEVINKNLTKHKTLNKINIKVNRPDLGSNVFRLASHVVQGFSTFLDLSLILQVQFFSSFDDEL